MHNDEITLLKSHMIDLGDGLAVLVAYQYHVEKTEHLTKDSSKSIYRYIARVDSLENFKKDAATMLSNERRLEQSFYWPDDPMPYKFVANKGTDNYSIGTWLNTKIKKLRSWDLGQKILKGWKNETKSHPEEYDPKAAYEIDGYVDAEGNTYSLTDLEALKKLVGKNIWKNIQTARAKKKSMTSMLVA